MGAVGSTDIDVITLADSEITGPILAGGRARNGAPRVVIARPDGSGPTDTTAHPLGSRPDIVVSEERAPDEPCGHLDATAIDGLVSVDDLLAAVRARPRAASALALVQRDADRRGLHAGLVAESAAYSMLLAGGEFRAWLAERAPHHHAPSRADPVLVERTGDDLTITLHRPEVHNAADAALLAAWADALDVALADPSIAHVTVRGDGPTFSSGGDLDEFGTFTDPVAAHLLRLERSTGARIDALGDRISVTVHGACRGSGVELPAFAPRVVAHPDTTFALPEVAMGLIPGAGGTVSLTRRIGRLRTTTLALSGATIDAACARRWGLIDEIGRQDHGS